ARRRAERARRRTSHLSAGLAAERARGRLRLPPRLLGRRRRAGQGERIRRRGAVPVLPPTRAAVRRRGPARLGGALAPAARDGHPPLLLLHARGRADGAAVRATSARATAVGSTSRGGLPEA